VETVEGLVNDGEGGQGQPPFRFRPFRAAFLPDRSRWAVIQTDKHHGGRIEDVVVLELAIPRKWRRRNRRGRVVLDARHSAGLYQVRG
jgi:hypothetical protein